MYDAIIVGARCAGSPTAMLLARKGYRVLLVDKATFPSDTISTHILWPHGVDVLARWGLSGLLESAGTPPIGRPITFDLGPFVLRGTVPDANGGRGGFCPRRKVLDALLLDAAAASGAEVRSAFTVERLLFDESQDPGAAQQRVQHARLARLDAIEYPDRFDAAQDVLVQRPRGRFEGVLGQELDSGFLTRARDQLEAHAVLPDVFLL